MVSRPRSTPPRGRCQAPARERRAGTGKSTNHLAAPAASPVPSERPLDPHTKRKYATPPNNELQRSSWLAEHPLPKNVRANSQNDANYDGRSSRSRWARQQIRRLEQWIQKQFKRKAKIFNVGVVPNSNPPDSGHEENLIPKPKRSVAGSTESTASEQYTRTMKLELIDKNNNSVVRSVQVLLDTGNPRNILSSRLVQTFNLGLENDRERVALKTMGNNEWYSIGKIKGRLILKSSDPKWIDAEFEVSKCDEHYDAVLGSKFLHEYKMVKVSEDVPHAFSGFRCKPLSYTSKL